MKPVFLYKKGCGINPEQLQKLRREGYVPVGVNYLDNARLLDAPILSSPEALNAIGHAALETIAECGVDWIGRNFAKKLNALLKIEP